MPINDLQGMGFEKKPLISTNTEEKKASKKAYWREKKREARKKQKHLSVIFSKNTAEEIEKIAEQYGYPMAQVVRKIVEFHLQNQAIYPSELIEKFERTNVLLRQQGNLLNQLTKVANTNKHISPAAVQQVHDLLAQQMELVQQIFK